MQIFRFNEREYYIEIDEGEGSDTRMRAYSTALGGATLLNVQLLGVDPPRGFYFAAYSVEGDGRLRFRILESDKLRANESSSRELAHFVAENLGDPSLYQQPAFLCESDEK